MAIRERLRGPDLSGPLRVMLTCCFEPLRLARNFLLESELLIREKELRGG